MAEALVRSCNHPTCRTRFVKTDGCNVMRCPRCSNHQCYVCSRNIEDYSHFGDKVRDFPMFDPLNDVEIRHQEKVRNAEEAVKIRMETDATNVNPKHLKSQPGRAFGETEDKALTPARFSFWDGDLRIDTDIELRETAERPTSPHEARQDRTNWSEHRQSWQDQTGWRNHVRRLEDDHRYRAGSKRFREWLNDRH